MVRVGVRYLGKREITEFLQCVIKKKLSVLLCTHSAPLSTELHRNGFIGFIVCSMLHMLAFLVHFKRVRTPLSARVSLDTESDNGSDVVVHSSYVCGHVMFDVQKSTDMVLTIHTVCTPRAY